MQTLLNLLAGVSLLIWGTHIVSAGVTGLTQSSPATALIVAAFAGQGIIDTAPALAVMLGADVGTSLVTVVLSLDLSWLAPLLIFGGVTLFLAKQPWTGGSSG